MTRDDDVIRPRAVTRDATHEFLAHPPPQTDIGGRVLKKSKCLTSHPTAFSFLLPLRSHVESCNTRVHVSPRRRSAAGNPGGVAQSQTIAHSQRVSPLFDCDEQADVLHSCVFEMPMILLVHTHIHILLLITHSMPRYESCHMKQFKRGRTEAVRWRA